MSKYDTLILGAGETGRSAIPFLQSLGERVAIADSRENPPQIEELKSKFPSLPIYSGEFNLGLLKSARRILISPGINPNLPIFHALKQSQIPVVSDIEIFSQNVKAPIIAVTGSNGKSTVTTLTAKMFEAAGCSVGVGGNLGPAALTLLMEKPKDFYILEISSYQLETTDSLKTKSAVVLNVTPDHLDRHVTMSKYRQLKWRIYKNCTHQIYNLDFANGLQNKGSFGYRMSEPENNEFGIRYHNGTPQFAFGKNLLFPTSICKLPGKHSWSNILACCALAHAAGISAEAMQKAVSEFKGLPHRCQFVKELKGAKWYNDSKATNSGATIAAINGLKSENTKEHIILILGGIAKEDNFLELAKNLSPQVSNCLIFGQDTDKIFNDVKNYSNTYKVKDLEEAVGMAAKLTKPGDKVLFSPACASFDMFENFASRGTIFEELVKNL